MKLSKVETADSVCVESRVRIKKSNHKSVFKVDKKTITTVFLILLGAADFCSGIGQAKDSAISKPNDADSIEMVLRQLNEKTSEMRTYQSQIEYLFKQPMLESETVRKGVLYYQRSGGQSALRIDFQRLKQDDEEEQKHIEQYVFDGVWLTHIDHQIKTVKRHQLAEANEPVDAFELASRNFPIIGFRGVEDLKKEFEISLVEQQEGRAEDFIQLRLRVKPDSVYKDDYTCVVFWIDKKLYLPMKIVATSTESDIYQIRFIEPRVNKRIDKKVFDVKIPEGFGGPEIIPLRKKT